MEKIKYMTGEDNSQAKLFGKKEKFTDGEPTQLSMVKTDSSGKYQQQVRKVLLS